MDAERLLQRINARHATDFRVQARYAAGENHGAHALIDSVGERAVLKYHQQPQRLPGLDRARLITDRLRSRGAPVPIYRMAGAFADGYTYWIQSAVDGAPPETLTDSQLTRLLELNDLQAGQAISQEQNWTDYVIRVVFAGESGWAGSLRRHSAATRDVLSRIERLVTGKQTCLGVTTDIVHGDLVTDNILVHEERLSGIVDWDAAGCGDRTLDLAKPLYYSYANAPIRDRLRDRIVALRGRDALRVYLAYAILAQTDWSIRHHPLAAVDDLVALAHAILSDLGAP